MDAGAKGWMIQTARKNYWRVASWYDLDDLFQDGYLLWYMVRAKYVQYKPGIKISGRARDKAHVMSLFKRTFTNHIHDLAARKTRQVDFAADIDFGVLPIIDATSELERVIVEAPALVKETINAYTSGKMKRSHRRRVDDTRETTNERLAKAIGINGEAPDLRELVRQYLEA